MSVKRILAIDNEPCIQEVAQICLETIAGWQVLLASSGAEGSIVAAAEQPDAILLDLMMPGMDGIATFKQLQANPATRDIPVILLTAKVQPRDRSYYTSLGIKGQISKPFDPIALAEEISRLLNWN
jgi:CheY-like chemotaxis protein